MQNNIVARPLATEVFDTLVKQKLEPLTATVLAARGIADSSEIFPRLQQLPQPEQLAGVVSLASQLAQIIQTGEAICIVGDYDVDGVTSTALAYLFLQELGANVSWYLPNRKKNGYGLSAMIVEEQAQQDIKHILTVDNGTCAHEGIARAQALGMCVYVIDHHQPDDVANGAEYMVNPQVDNGGCALFNHLVGVGVTFYVMAQLRQEMNSTIDMAAYLDLVALGSIADCAELDISNRALIGAGLARIRQGKTRFGVKALVTENKIKLKSVNSRVVGFRLAPRINAAGRMGSADVALQCLLADNPTTARQQAKALTTLNQQRLAQQEEVMAEALLQIENTQTGIAVAAKEWHPGVLGIVASKIADRYQRPAFAFYYEQGTHWRASGRAPAPYNLMEILKAISDKNPEVISYYGGHRQAASVVVHNECLPIFTKLLQEVCTQLAVDTSTIITKIDAPTAKEISIAALKQLEHVVWGNGFPSPLYRGRFYLLQQDPLRGGHLRLSLADTESDKIFSAVHFGCTHIATDEIDILYSAEINNYDQQIQLIVDKIL